MTSKFNLLNAETQFLNGQNKSSIDHKTDEMVSNPLFYFIILLQEFEISERKYFLSWAVSWYMSFQNVKITFLYKEQSQQREHLNMTLSLPWFRPDNL